MDRQSTLTSFPAADSSARILLGSLDADFLLVDEALGQLADQRSGGTGGQGHLAGVHAHVPGLNAAGGQGADGGQVLGKTHTDHDLGQLRGGFYPNILRFT